MLWDVFWECLESPVIWVCMLFVQGEDPYLRIVLNTKETLPDFLEIFCERLVRGLFPYALVTAWIRSWHETKFLFIECIWTIFFETKSCPPHNFKQATHMCSILTLAQFFIELSITLASKIVSALYFSPWNLETNSLVPEVAFHQSL